MGQGTWAARPLPRTAGSGEPRFPRLILALLLLSAASVLALGCGKDPSGPEDGSASHEVRLVQPADGDTVQVRVRLVAEVTLGEPVWRVVFFADDQPIVIATEVPWEADWIPTDAHSARSYRIHAEAIGSTLRVQSKPATVWVRNRQEQVVWIELPGRSGWVERTPEAFARVRACDGRFPDGMDSSLAQWQFEWSGPDLARPFHGQVLPLGMLPERKSEVTVEARAPDGSSFQSSRPVRTFRYPTEDEPTARTIALAYAIGARDLGLLPAALHPSFVFLPCKGLRGAAPGPMAGDAFMALLEGVLDSKRLLDTDWTWIPVLVHQWRAEGNEWALVRTDRWHWRFVVSAEEISPCQAMAGAAHESSGGGASLLWTREPGAPWRLARWNEHSAPHVRSLAEWSENPL